MKTPSSGILRSSLALASALVATLACGEPMETPDPSQYFQPTDALAAPDEKVDGAIRIAWFGHSLVQRPDDIAIDLPKLVYQLHEAARADGRTTQAQRPPRAFILLGRHLGHHLDGPGDAAARMRELKDAGITHVVGIGFMHMLGESLFKHPTLSLWAMRLGITRYDSPRIHTDHIYRLMGLMRKELPAAKWVSYVGPALSMNVAPQPAIDARHACIEESARAAGVDAISAHVGRAFRNAEAAAKTRPELKLALQAADGLHLAPQGAVLAASVLYQRIYGVDPVWLAVPEPYFSKLGDTDEARRAMAMFVQETARTTNAQYAPACGERLPEDEAAAETLSDRTN